MRCARRRVRGARRGGRACREQRRRFCRRVREARRCLRGPGTPPPPRKTAQELAAALEAVSAKLEPAAAPEPKSPRPWSFKRTLHSPSRTPKRFFGSKRDDDEPKKLWEDGDASDAGDAPPRVSLEELDEFVDVVALNKRTGKRSIIRLARGTVMSDVSPPTPSTRGATRRSSSSSAATALRRAGPSRPRRASRTCGAPPPRGAPARTPRKKREPKKSFDEQIWNRAVAIGHDAWDEKHFGSLDAGESVALPLNRAEIRPDVEYMELSIDLGDEPPPVSDFAAAEFAEACVAGDGRHGGVFREESTAIAWWRASRYAPAKSTEAGVEAERRHGRLLGQEPGVFVGL